MTARDALAKAAAGELLGPTDMQAIWGIRATRYHTLVHEGAFDLFKVKPAIGRRCYSGVLVHRYIQGQAVYEPAFSRKKLG